MPDSLPLLDVPADYAEAMAALKRDLLARNDIPAWTANSTQPVMGEGPQHPLLMFIGEGPVFLLFAGAAAVATVLQFALLPVITKARQAPRVVRSQPVA